MVKKRMKHFIVQENRLNLVFVDIWYTYNLQLLWSVPLKSTWSIKILLFKSLINCKRRNKVNFTLKFNSNKIMLSTLKTLNLLLMSN